MRIRQDESQVAFYHECMATARKRAFKSSLPERTNEIASRNRTKWGHSTGRLFLDRKFQPVDYGERQMTVNTKKYPVFERA